MPYMHHHLVVVSRYACRRFARLSGVSRLRPHADGLCREDVELDQDGRARHHHARRDHARQFHASVAGGAEGRAAASKHPCKCLEPKADAPAVKSDKGADAGSAIKPDQRSS